MMKAMIIVDGLAAVTEGQPCNAGNATTRDGALVDSSANSWPNNEHFPTTKSLEHHGKRFKR